jgi:dipeptidyl aminopeptidase/acylaminoacyl peptidase
LLIARINVFILSLENSPVFFADKVETPLMIMHNDNDGAVPWYQGIEYFVALRRLNKPVWMINYNGDSHNLMKKPNMIDLSIRLSQFFDHYLKDAPAPNWMTNGVTATEKDKQNSFKLLE